MFDIAIDDPAKGAMTTTIEPMFRNQRTNDPHASGAQAIRDIYWGMFRMYAYEGHVEDDFYMIYLDCHFLDVAAACGLAECGLHRLRGCSGRLLRDF